jgi:hypothetical protein
VAEENRQIGLQVTNVWDLLVTVPGEFEESVSVRMKLRNAKMHCQMRAIARRTSG